MVELEILRWAVLTAMLVWFSLMKFISRIRRELNLNRRN
jgi:hypothetical protein